jgi:LytS/YehU family sensor histidine kinase
MGAMIPHFLLQPLVENAVKHGVAASRRPVTVRVAARQEGADLVLSVQDDGAAAAPPAPGAAMGTGVGLANVRARLAALYGAAGSLVVRALSPGFEAEIRLPLAFGETVRRAA